MTPEQAYEKIAELARKYALVYQAYGGVMIIVHPDTQKEQGIYEHIQWVHGLGPHPSTYDTTNKMKRTKGRNKR